MADSASSTQPTKSHAGILRAKRNPFKKESGSSRRVSCKDLGNGDCEGWLWKKAEKPGFVSRDWKKFWFTLKDKSLYYYKHKEDDMAQGIFQMPAFTVSPASEKDSSRKFAFKVTHPKYGTFLFASQRKEDMVKWMNMLQIACLIYVNPKQLNTIISVEQNDYSGSESEDDQPTDSSLQSPTSETTSIESSGTPSSNNPDMFTASFAEYCGIPSDRASGLIEMTIRQDARTVFERSVKRRSIGNQFGPLYSHLASLQRTLKDKEMQLNILEEFLVNSSPITPEALKKFFRSSLVVEILEQKHKTEHETEHETEADSE